MELDHLLVEPPPGFRVDRSSKGHLIIHYKSTGMGGMNAFLIVWLTIWNFGLILMIFKRDGNAPGIPEIAIFAAIDFGVLALASYLWWTKRTFTIDDQGLVYVSRWFGFEKRILIQKSEIKSFQQIQQIQDGGDLEDSFPSWGLTVHTSQRFQLIVRQPYASSLWLGRVLGEWSGVEFRSMPSP